MRHAHKAIGTQRRRRRRRREAIDSQLGKRGEEASHVAEHCAKGKVSARKLAACGGDARGVCRIGTQPSEQRKQRVVHRLLLKRQRRS